jgi:pimeloyl-ACP methyl ester carboxylesterase
MASERHAFEAAEHRLFDRYGLRVASRFFDTDGRRARYLELGSGDPVVFLHGGGAVAAEWAPLFPHLAGRRLIAVDRPGCGLSDPVDYREVDLRRHAVEFIEDLLDALGVERVPLVANSMGGLWSLWFALDRPQRVRCLALLGCPAVVAGTSAPFVMRLLSVRRLNQLMMKLQPPSPKQARALYASVAGKPAVDTLPQEFFDLAYHAQLLPGADTSFLTLLERVLRLRGARPAVRLDDSDVGRICQPVLFVWGDRDAFGGPAHAHRARQAVPASTLEVIDAGHVPWLDDAPRCAALLDDFLARDWLEAGT